MALQVWRRLPHLWIEDKGLRKFRWRDGAGADNTAALMLLAVVVHQVDADTGLVRLTYDRLQQITGLSRSKVSRGLAILVSRGIIERTNARMSEIRLLNADAPRWAKFPTRGLYKASGQVGFFQHLTLRRKVELDALKLWFLLCARRNGQTGLVNLSYVSIESYAGLDKPAIRDALSLLIHFGLVVVEKVENELDGTVSSAYRVRYIDPYRHAGTAKAAEPVEIPF